MKLLLTNDDGIAAPGLQALAEAAVHIGTAIIAAPAHAHSGCSHQVTTHAPIAAVQGAPGRWTVHGTPADCVRLALHRLAPDTAFILSGINAGGNLGADVYISGTVAAVREGVLHGKPGIAVSHYIKRGLEIDWHAATAAIVPILQDLTARPWTPGTFWNINLPHLEPGAPPPEVVHCPLDPEPLPLSFRLDGDDHHYDGNYHQRPRRPGSDVDVCFQGKIAVTQLRLF